MHGSIRLLPERKNLWACRQQFFNQLLNVKAIPRRWHFYRVSAKPARDTIKGSLTIFIADGRYLGK